MRSSASQQAVEFIGSIAHKKEIVDGVPSSGYEYSYSTQFFTHGQAFDFISTDYEKKACVNLGQIFIPYATYSGEYFPQGYNSNASLQGEDNYISSGICLTVSDTLTNFSGTDSDNIYYGNTRMNSGEPYWSGDNTLYQRSIGINRNTFFVGDTPESDGSGTRQVAGPLSMTWQGDQWVAGNSIVYGYPVDYKSKYVAESGFYEFRLGHIGADDYIDRFISGVAIFTEDGSGIVELYYCRSYDTGAGHIGRQTFVAAAKVPYFNPDGSTSGESFYLPIYRGCTT